MAFMNVTCGLTAKKPGSAACPVYGTALLYLIHNVALKCVHINSHCAYSFRQHARSIYKNVQFAVCLCATVYIVGMMRGGE